MNDEWKHRSSGMQCRTCMFFVEKASTLVFKRPVDTNTEEAGPKPPFGRCRRHAPTMGGYPAVFGHDWCGDHKLDENKT